MTEQFILRSHDVEITTHKVRIDNTTYQIANIGSVSLLSHRRMNPIATFMIWLGIACVALLIFVLFSNHAASMSLPLLNLPWLNRQNISLGLAAGGVALLGLGFIIQNRHPHFTYTVTFKTSSGDSSALFSHDYQHVTAVKAAIEQAFSSRGA